MSNSCEYERRWPELWEPLSEPDRWVLSQALADDASGDVSREQIVDLAEYLAGNISADEYEQRAEWRLVGTDPVEADRRPVVPARVDIAA
ncbi:hypothetical protein [Rhodococcus sp. NPDC127528]|uniref:hypothetical protein n=1 Tax=unclassified Rhodococcus (in: high G+C Gram-positive bacteria) TaxID=192944 RepID=UPI00363E5DDA